MDKTGLTTKEAEELLAKYGPNELPEKRPPSDLSVFLSQLKSPLIYVLLFAATVTLYLKEFADTVIILVAVGINTILGFLQESRAGKALEALKELIHPYAKVIRDGKVESLLAANIVPGDIVVLNSGDKIPADGVLIEESRFYVSEAILTGESTPVLKKVKDKIFMGTIVTAGTAKMLVQVTGAKTQMGAIAKSVSGISEDTPLKKQLSAFSKSLSVLVLILLIVIFGVGLLSGVDPVDLFTTSVALAVSAIPEGLLVSLTVVLAIGMQRILARKGLVRHLVSAETLGGVTTLCVDKTGTLTEGNMRVVEVVGDNKNLIEQVIIANDLDDPIVIAAWDWGSKHHGHAEELLNSYPRLDSIPFSPSKRYFASLNKLNDHENIVFVNGAPETLINNSTLGSGQRKKLFEEIDTLTATGKRLLGFARKTVYKGKSHLKDEDAEKDLEWVGLIAFEDPIRKDVKEALKKTKLAGISLIVITGDYAATAKAVMDSLGISLNGNGVTLGEDLEKLTDGELEQKLNNQEKAMLFARTRPDQKLRIVNALQANGRVVAMMGDGVNDETALKKSDIGIVVGDATDVAKESSDLVLLDSSFSTIVAAIEEGRGIFDNIRKIILYLMSDAFEEIILVLLTFIFKFPMPITAVQILWVNLISDGFPNLALTVDPKVKGIMRMGPRSPKEPLVSNWMKKIMLVISLVGGLFAFGLFILSYRITGNIVFARSVTFATVGINSLIYVFSIRTLREPFWKENPLDNRWLNVAVVSGMVLQFVPFIIRPVGEFLGVVPIHDFWFFVFGVSLVVFLIIEISKHSFRHYIKK